MFNILLQFDSTAISTLPAGDESLFSLLVKGGVLMIPLAIFMAMAIFFFIERLIAIRKASKIEDNFMNIIRDHIISGNITAAASLAKNTHHPVAKMIDKGIKRIGKPIDAIEKSMIRRASRVYVFNESGKLLVQQRSEKVLKPLMLDQSAAGHVDEGESYEQAAYRELEEELGIKGLELELVVTSFRTTDFYNAIYRVTVPDDTEINFDHEEIQQVIWYDIETLNNEINSEPEKFTPAFKEAWAALGNKLTT